MARSMASEASRTEAHAIGDSNANATASGGSVANAAAVADSEADAIAEVGSQADATSTTDGASVAFANGLSVATATGTTGGLAGATAEGSSEAKAAASGGRDLASTASSLGFNEIAVGPISDIFFLALDTPDNDLVGEPDAAVPIPFDLLDDNGTLADELVISDLPAGTVLSSGSSNGDGTEWTLTPGDVPLTLTPPSGFQGTIEFSVTARRNSAPEDFVSATQRLVIEDDGSPLDFGDAPDAIRFNGSNYVDELVLNGDAAFVENGQDVLRLTPAENGSTGSAYLEDPFVITPNGSLITKIDFRIHGSTSEHPTGGADGFAVVLQDSADGAAALQSSTFGSALGLNGIEKSVAVAFQTAFDDNHIRVFTNGNMASGEELASVEVAQPLNDGTVLFAWITYDGTTDELQVFLSDTNSDMPTGNPVLTHTIDISPILGDQAYAGLSSATGGLNDNHDILAWTFGASDYQTFLRQRWCSACYRRPIPGRFAAGCRDQCPV